MKSEYILKGTKYIIMKFLSHQLYGNHDKKEVVMPSLCFMAAVDGILQ